MRTYPCYEKNFVSFRMRIFLRLIYSFCLLTLACCTWNGGQKNQELSLERIPDVKPRSIIFILTDDHRFDFMGFTGKVPWLKTPHLDRLAKEGLYFSNTYVTTALCSPSRASILTGLFSHSHTVVDNQAPVPEDLTFFPQYLQQAGYQTGFFGKWHMGEENDTIRPGFDHWESFRGQGVYYNPTLNINGNRVTYGDSTYITDLLTNHAVEWLQGLDKNKPFLLYLSHKAVHSEFAPARRHAGVYANEPVTLPPSFRTSDQRVKGKQMGQYSLEQGPLKPLDGAAYYGEGRVPDWQKMQRESWHGVDYMYHGQLSFPDFYRKYCEALLAVDESVGEILQYLDQHGLSESTLVIYMSDNGFSFGEHGLIDKRHFYEESAKVPFLIRCEEMFAGGRTVEQMIQNIDVAPTLLEVAGIKKPSHMQGRSIVPLLAGNPAGWRDHIFYEYYWEYDFPHTPTMHGMRDEQYKLIRYHGIWDTNEFYDLQADPFEMNNLIAHPAHQERIEAMTGQIYDWLEATDGMRIPLKRTVKKRFGDHRNQGLY